MGSLLMQYEYQRASRECTICERTGIRLNNLLGRYTKRIENMQSVFQKAQDRLTHNYDRLSQSANNAISQAVNGCAAAGDASGFIGALNGIVIGGIALGSFVQVGNLQGASKEEILTALSNSAAQAKTSLSQLIEQAKEADLQRLQEQQDEQLYPISEKEADIQAEIATNDTLQTIWEKRCENAKQRLGQDIEKGIAGYGLK